MLLIMAKTGQILDGSLLLSATFRTDLVPVPATLEFTVKSSAQLETDLVVGAEVLVGDSSLSMTLVRVQPLKTQTIKDGSRVGGIACVGVLTGCLRLIDSISRAVILKDATVGGALRACGASLAFSDDLPLSEFVCLKGQLPTVEVAKRLQQEAAVMMVSGGRLSVMRIDALMKAEPVGRFDPSSVVWHDSPVVTALSTPSFVSVAADGSGIEGAQTRDGRPVRYYPKLNERQLKNMQKVLICRGVMTRPLDATLQAGSTIWVGDRRLVILTAAHRVDTGAIGGNAAHVSKVWLGSL
jgi:hypothetical protein